MFTKTKNLKLKRNTNYNCKALDIEESYQPIEIIKNTLKMIGSRGVQIPLQIISVLIIPKLLTPNSYGLWRSILLITHYCGYSQLGTHQAMLKEMPLMAGRGIWTQRQIVSNNTFYFNLFITVFLFIILLICSFFLSGENSEFYSHGFRIIGLIVIMLTLTEFYFQLLRVNKDFTWLSILTILNPFLNVSFSIVFLLLFSNPLSLVYALALSYIIIICLSIYKCGWPRYKYISFYEIYRLIRIGFPLLLIPIMDILIKGVDQITIISFLDPTNFGYYSLAISIQGFIYFAPTAIGGTLVPYLFEHYGKTNDPKKSSHYFLIPTKLISLFTAICLATTYLFIHIPIKYFLQKYIPGLQVLYILLLSLYCTSLIMIAGNFLVICGKDKSIIKIQTLIIVCSCFTNYIAVKYGYGIIGVAYATLATYFIYSTIMLMMTFKLFLRNYFYIIKEAFILYVPLIYISTVLILLNFILPNNSVHLWNDIKTTITQVITLTAMYAPFIFLYDKFSGSILFSFKTATIK